MDIVLILGPFSVLLGLVGLGAFWWTLKNGQYDDPRGDAERILLEDEEAPATLRPRAPSTSDVRPEEERQASSSPG